MQQSQLPTTTMPSSSSTAIEDERNVIHWSREAVATVNGGYAQLSETQLMRWPAVGLLLNLLHCAFEHLDAAIVSFPTGSATSFVPDNLKSGVDRAHR